MKGDTARRGAVAAKAAVVAKKALFRTLADAVTLAAPPTTKNGKYRAKSGCHRHASYRVSSKWSHRSNSSRKSEFEVHFAR